MAETQLNVRNKGEKATLNDLKLRHDITLNKSKVCMCKSNILHPLHPPIFRCNVKIIINKQLMKLSRSIPNLIKKTPSIISTLF